MEKTDDFIADRIKWKAQKFELPTGSSFFYGDVSSDIRQYLSKHFDETVSGNPVLFFTKPTNEWTLVCTRQVVCNDNDAVFTIPLKEMHQLKSKVFDSKLAGFTNHEKRHKSEWDELVVTDKHGQKFVLHADKGKDLFALWNILLMVIRII